MACMFLDEVVNTYKRQEHLWYSGLSGVTAGLLHDRRELLGVLTLAPELRLPGAAQGTHTWRTNA